MAPNYQPLSSTVKMVEIQQLYGLVRKYASASPPEGQWNKLEQSLFIDSIWNHYPMNPLVFRIVGDGPDAKIICIDGNERLSAIKSFIDGTIPWIDSCSPFGQQWWYDCRSDLSVTDMVLTKSQQAAFESTRLSCTFVRHLSEVQAEEIVRRLRH
ncbi:hypothetical protein K435DRAFT_867242 [Dendrothele bispora CBS 962.96]|uniref:DUF262 domain-containing protein n=1 Tax=Dendrothele bispora (strain CBS 962.96) TaxID=1314807 RepID=A0A4V4HDM1_DENBC|nr:hypothetical protein K435DRAFT_867242 [Dendrothele bispora CBS 962.96]